MWRSLIISAFFAAGIASAQERVCDLFKNLPASNNRMLTVTGELLISSRTMALGASDCDNRYEAALHIAPVVLRLKPSPSAPAMQMAQLKAAAAGADRLRRSGKVVTASATFTGRLVLTDAYNDDLPANLIFDSFADLKVEALPDAGTLPVIPICELFQNLAAWKGQRIAVRGEGIGTMEGYWINGRCKSAFYTNGYRWPVSLNYGGPAYGELPGIPGAKEPSAQPKGAREFRNRFNVTRTATYIGRLKMRDQYTVVCRVYGDYITNGFGHLNSATAELIIEEVRDVELTKREPVEDIEEESSCESPERAAVCTNAATLQVAVGFGCAARVAEFLRKDGIDSKGPEESKLLDQAIRRGDEVIVKMLIDAGAPVNPAKFIGSPPLSEAAWFRKIAVMRLLIKKGAKVDAVDGNGAPYLTTFGYTDLGVLKSLLDSGANPNASDSDGSTALMGASSCGLDDSVEVLIAHGAKVNQADKDGKTALMYAANGKYVDAIPLLLKAGADIHARDHNGRTALDLARSSKNQAAVEMLSAR
jgi:Ankyrin repeats (3 copies)